MSALAGIPSATASATKVTKSQEIFDVGKIDVNTADSWRFRHVVCGQGLNCLSFFKLRRVATTKHSAYLSDDLSLHYIPNQVHLPQNLTFLICLLVPSAAIFSHFCYLS